MDNDNFITDQFLKAIGGGAQDLAAFMASFFPGVTPAQALEWITQADDDAADLGEFDDIAAAAWDSWQE